MKMNDKNYLIYTDSKNRKTEA